MPSHPILSHIVAVLPCPLVYQPQSDKQLRTAYPSPSALPRFRQIRRFEFGIRFTDGRVTEIVHFVVLASLMIDMVGMGTKKKTWDCGRGKTW